MKSIIGNAPLLSASHLGPGVYFLLAENGELLYVGKSSSNCMKRICQHKAAGRIPFYHYFVIPIGRYNVTAIEAFLTLFRNLPRQCNLPIFFNQSMTIK